MSIDAGIFGEWLSTFRASLRNDVGADVPCGDCVGCCVSSYHIPIRPQDAQARAAIDAEHLTIAHGQPRGHSMMRYLADGRCPMLTLAPGLNVGTCSIYHSRPQTCRDYDCRVFAAAGIAAGGADKHVINKRVNEWQFTYKDEADRLAHQAVRAAAAFIRDKRNFFPNGRAPTAPTGIAVLAVKVYQIFLDLDDAHNDAASIANRIVRASGEFDADYQP